MKEVVKTTKSPGAIGPYSQAIKVNDFMYCSGMLPINIETGEMPEGISQQTKQALNNIKALLESQNLSMSNIVKTTVFLDNMNDFASMNEVYASFFEEPYPARSAVEVARLPKDALIEIEVIVALK